MKYKVGLLGAGYILDSHAKALRALPEVALQAVCDASKQRAQAASARHDIPLVFTSLDGLLASDCDVVHVLLPPPLHVPAALELVRAGKSVFLEKPMGIALEECESLSEEGESLKRVIGVNHNFLFSPAYEELRNAVHAGELGRIENLSVNWHFALPQLLFGPFDTWMLSGPANILFEVGSHAAAFILDLINKPQICSVVAGGSISLPTGKAVFRDWTVVMRDGNATAIMSVNANSGHPDRLLRVRGRGGSAQLDFGRGVAWRESTATDNPILDSYSAAQSIAKALSKASRRDLKRRLKAAIVKRPEANPFEETLFRSIRAFYSGGIERVDSRHSARFASRVVGMCEASARAANVEPQSRQVPAVLIPKPIDSPSVLVVGGSGFIGRRLVRELCRRGQSVRVLTRSAKAAVIELGGLPVELIEGHHGDPETADRALHGIDVVYHLAKCDGRRWQDYVAGDIEPTRVLAEAALKQGVSRFIYTGTIASYDCASSRKRIDNLTPVDPAIAKRNHYARSKAACENLLQEMHRTKGFPVVILRPGIVIGPGSPPAHLGVGRFASETRMTYFGDGRNPLPLVLVDDVAEALALALEKPDISGKTMLVTSPPLLTAREYVEEVARAMGSKIDARPRAAWRYWVQDLGKEILKNVIRHPNRRWPTLHDSRCLAHCAQWDGSMTERDLDWHPVSDRSELISRGIDQAVAWYTR
jgi:nucleoside-diphosphate-sugar epimerase/predicted dehydrogenase